MGYKAVIFDIGGVCAPSPMVFLGEYSKSHGLPAGYISYAIGRAPSWFLLERGLATLNSEFYDKFTSEILAEASWMAFHAPKPAPPLPPSARSISSREILVGILRSTNRPDAGVIRVIKRLKAAVPELKLGVITNDINVPEDLARETDIPPNEWLDFRGLFNVWISSSTIHMRKPDRRIYELALKELDVKGEGAIFLDDIGANLKSAAGVGIKTVRVEIGKMEEAVKTLESLLDVKLLDEFRGSAGKARL